MKSSNWDGDRRRLIPFLLVLLMAAPPARAGDLRPDDAAGGFAVSGPPDSPDAAEPPALGVSAPGGSDFRSLDSAALDKYDAAFELDKSTAADPEEKSRSWSRIARDVPAYAEMAAKRAAEWDAFAARKKSAAEVVRKRAEARDADWAKLSRLLTASAIPEEEKARWSAEFVEAYRTSPGLEPAMAAALAPHALVEGAARDELDAPALETPGRAGIRWVRIRGGSFTMGSEDAMGTADADFPVPKPTHQVKVKPFQMSKTLVTNKQYKACVTAGACTPAHAADGKCTILDGTDWRRGNLPASFLGDDQPAVCVDWRQARTFAAWAGGRLPSEAEWEYAARGGGRDQKYPWGDEPATCERAATEGCVAATTPVCSKPAGNTRQGLCDMAGDVWEWVEDTFHETYAGAPSDGGAWKDEGAFRVRRGGSWVNEAGFSARAAYRAFSRPEAFRSTWGFRLTKLPDAPSGESPQDFDTFITGGLDFRSLDAASLDKYNAAYELDKSTEAEPSERARSWRQLARDVPKYAEMADKRAAQWDAFAARTQAAAETSRRLLGPRDTDWEQLGRLLTLTAILEKDKARWSDDFLKKYWDSPGLEPAMAKALLPHVTVGGARRLELLALSLKGKAGIEWVDIPAGSFAMGSEEKDLGDSKPVHRVTVKAFQMAKTLVTNKQYRACVEAGECTPAHATDGTCLIRNNGHILPGGLSRAFLGDDQPVVCVDWAQAKAFAEWAGGRLPSEAEWEYAARSAGEDWKYPWGNEAPDCSRAAIIGCGDATVPVCWKPLGNTRQGLCDMAGNAFEWVQDYFHYPYDGAPSDGSAWDDENSTRIDRASFMGKWFGPLSWEEANSARIGRGGAWSIGAAFARSAARFIQVPGTCSGDTGFRIAR